MPYSKTSKRPKRVVRKRKMTYTRQVARQEAKKIIIRQAESKMWDGATPFPTTVSCFGDVWNLLEDPSGGTIMTQGTGLTQYIGESITPSHIVIRWNAKASDSYNTIRILVFQVKNDWTPIAPIILQSTGNIRTPLSALDTDSMARMRILYDTMFTVNAAGPEARSGRITLPMKKIRKVTFEDPNGNYEDGGLWMVVYTDSTGSPDPDFNAYWRVYYKDM
jgi:hypothetical protein